MINKLEEYISSAKLFNKEDRILLAVSGGIDSMVMLHLLRKSNYDISVAHCNFQLRDKESEMDEEFLTRYCNEEEIPLYKTKFNTIEYARENGISIQMAARDLRYNWLENTRYDNKYDFIATGHNLDDIVETMLLNLTRGTGIRGLTGIKAKSGKIIRPLLFASRHMIEIYAQKNNVSYREDSSNKEIKYKRNKIRHKVIPVLEEINPSALYSITEAADHLQSAYQIYQHAVTDKLDRIIKQEENKQYVLITDLKKLNPFDTYLYELFKKWGFNKFQTGEVKKLIESSSGREIFSQTHRLTRDRDKIYINTRQNGIFETYIINSLSDFLQTELIDHAEIVKAEGFKIPEHKAYACLDADLIKYPLLIRKWEEGDYFFPLGMDGRKKISDLLIDTKIPVPEKEKVFVLEVNNKIAWVIGMRIDNRFRISSSSRDILLLKKKTD